MTDKVTALAPRADDAPPNNAMTVFVPTTMQQAFQLAEAMANGKLVPDHLRNSPSDCLMVIEQSMRWGMSPFAVAQSTSVVRGKLMFEGKLVAAVINSSRVLSGRLGYEFSGSGDDRKCKVSGLIRGETTPRDIEVVLKEVATDNGNWKKQPDQQLVYSGSRVWARRHTPELMLGVYVPEEFDDGSIIDGTATPHSASPQRPPYPDDAFKENFPKWEKVIKGGRKTAADVIATIETLNTLSDDQRRKIEAVKADPKQEGATQ